MDAPKFTTDKTIIMAIIPSILYYSMYLSYLDLCDISHSAISHKKRKKNKSLTSDEEAPNSGEPLSPSHYVVAVETFLVNPLC